MLDYFSNSYFGESECVVDKQRRIALPSNWRKADQRENNFVLFPGRYDSLALVPAARVDEMIASLRQLSFANPDAFLPMANIGARAHVCACDRQGRFALSQVLMEEAGIDNKVALVGAVTYIQIWKPESWREHRADTSAGLDVIQTVQEGTSDIASLLKGIK